jgi:hypothetical protein
MSPFIFAHGSDQWKLWATDLAAAAATMTLALLSFWRPLRHVHLVILPVAAWLIAFGRFGLGTPVPPAGQNQIITGLVLLMFCIIPSRASDPPAGRPSELLQEQSSRP